VSHLTPLTCEETFRRLDDYVDRELPPDERQRVEAHLADCLDCAREYRFEQSVIENLRGALRRLDIPPDLSGKVAERLQEARKKPS
jgi:anti-sigma factor (TIGR02949 family)